MAWIDVTAVLEKAPPSEDEVEQILEYTARRAKARFYADENFPSQAVTLLKNKGARVITAQDVNLLGHPDERHAAFALANGFVLVTCDRDYLNERRFPLISCPAIFVFDFGQGSTIEMAQAFRCLATVFRTPQFFDKWLKVDACRASWIETTRHLDGTTSRTRYRVWKGKIQEWVPSEG